MISWEPLKKEIDNLRDEYLDIVYRILIALEISEGEVDGTSETIHAQSEWSEFIQETYGYLADAPIDCGDQGKYEERETL